MLKTADRADNDMVYKARVPGVHKYCNMHHDQIVDWLLTTTILTRYISLNQLVSEISVFYVFNITIGKLHTRYHMINNCWCVMQLNTIFIIYNIVDCTK
jgi:hypothetical protein